MRPSYWLENSPLLLALLLISAVASAAEKIDINTASHSELQEIKGVGPVIAQRIIEARPFYSVDELIKVKGIGEKKLSDIKEEGFAWVDPNLQPTLQTQGQNQTEVQSGMPSPQENPIQIPTQSAPPQTERVTEPAQKLLAAAAEPLRDEYSGNQNEKSLPVFLIALTLAALSGAAILTLKNKLKNTYNKNV